MKKYAILRVEIDDQDNNVGSLLYSQVYTDLKDARDTIEHFMKQVVQDANPLQAGWGVLFKIVELSTVLGETRQVDYGSDAK